MYGNPTEAKPDVVMRLTWQRPVGVEARGPDSGGVAAGGDAQRGPPSRASRVAPADPAFFLGQLRAWRAAEVADGATLAFLASLAGHPGLRRLVSAQARSARRRARSLTGLSAARGDPGSAPAGPQLRWLRAAEPGLARDLGIVKVVQETLVRRLHAWESIAALADELDLAGTARVARGVLRDTRFANLVLVRIAFRLLEGDGS